MALQKRNFKTKKGTDIRVVNMGKVVPAQTQPYNSKEWLTYDRYAYDNMYPQHILSLTESSTHNAILQTKKRMTASSGFIVPADQPNTELFLRNINDLKEYGNDKGMELLRRTANDLAIFGGFAWEICWNRIGTRIHSVRHVPFQTLRRNKPDPETGETDGFWYCPVWGIGHLNDDYTGREYSYAPYERPRFIKEFREDARDVSESCILYYSRTNEFNSFYPVPDYHGAIRDIMTDIEISLFNENNVKNAFVPSVVISLPEQPSEEELRDRIREVEKQFTGGANAARILFLTGSPVGDGSGQQMPIVTPFSTTGNADIYIALSDQVTQRIITGHQCPSPSIAGIQVAGGLSQDSDKTRKDFELYYDTTIRSYQYEILTQINYILAVNGLYSFVELDMDATLAESQQPDVSQTYLTLNEMRVKAGYEPLPDPQYNVPLYFAQGTQLQLPLL